MVMDRLRYSSLSAQSAPASKAHIFYAQGQKKING